MIEIRVLRGIFGPKRDEVRGEWRRLHSEGLHDLYCSPNIVGVNKSRKMRSVGHVARTGDRRSAYVVLVGKKPDGKRQLGRSRHRCENNVKWIFKKCDEEAWN